MLSAQRVHGFTLIELLVTISLVAMLLAVGVPSMSTYLQNSRVASATQNFYSGLQLARTEAIRRNLTVEFILTNTAIAASDVANAVVAAADGRNWLVRAPDPAASGGFELIEAKSGLEGNGSAGAAAVQVAVTASGAFSGSIGFDGFGRTADQAPYTIDLTLADPAACAAAGGPIRCRRIRVSPGGQIMACDPAVAASDAADTRHC